MLLAEIGHCQLIRSITPAGCLVQDASDQPTPGSLCSSGGGALTDPRSCVLPYRSTGPGIRPEYTLANSGSLIPGPNLFCVYNVIGPGISSVLCRVRMCIITGLTRGHPETLNLYYSGYHPQSSLTNPTCFFWCRSHKSVIIKAHDSGALISIIYYNFP